MLSRAVRWQNWGLSSTIQPMDPNLISKVMQEMGRKGGKRAGKREPRCGPRLSLLCKEPDCAKGGKDSLGQNKEKALKLPMDGSIRSTGRNFNEDYFVRG